MENKILDFIKRRFKDDCEWVSGNCYYFAIILKERFPEGEIYYDVIYGHFVFQYDNQLYDWNGVYNLTDGFLINWKNFDDYDYLLKARIIRDCIL